MPYDPATLATSVADGTAFDDEEPRYVTPCCGEEVRNDPFVRCPACHDHNGCEKLEETESR